MLSKDSFNHFFHVIVSASVGDAPTETTKTLTGLGFSNAMNPPSIWCGFGVFQRATRRLMEGVFLFFWNVVFRIQKVDEILDLSTNSLTCQTFSKKGG